MNEKKIRHLPAIENDQVVGVVTTRDFLKGMLAEQQSVIDQPTNYTD